MPSHSPPSAVLFDLDGVLLDTEHLYTDASAQVVAEFGKTFDVELKARVMGRSATVSAAIVLEALDVPLSVEEFLSRRNTLLRPLFATACAKPGAEELVRWLHHCGVPKAVATSSTRELFALKTSLHPWFRLFDTVICGDDPRLERPKPAPDIFLLAARDLGAPAAACVVVEDSAAGVSAALAAGMRLVVLADPTLPVPTVPSQTPVLERHSIDTFRLLGIGSPTTTAARNASQRTVDGID